MSETTEQDKKAQQPQPEQAAVNENVSKETQNADVDISNEKPAAVKEFEGRLALMENELNAKKAELEAKVKEASDWKDQFLRKAADFDNYRKRMIKEKEDLAKFASSNLLTDLVQVLDDFERAIKSSENSKDFEAFHSGIVMIENQMSTLLENKYALKRFTSLGEAFKPEFHEAIAMDGALSSDAVVVEEYQKGYKLHDRVLRTAKVKVGTKKKDETLEDKKGTPEVPVNKEEKTEK